MSLDNNLDSRLTQGSARVLNEREKARALQIQRDVTNKPSLVSVTSVDPTAVVDLQRIPFKLYKYQSSSVAGVKLENDSVTLFGGPNSIVRINDEFGVMLHGLVGIESPPAGVRMAGLWHFNNLLTSTVPSTIMSPVPVLQFQIPDAIFRSFFDILGDIGGLV